MGLPAAPDCSGLSSAAVVDCAYGYVRELVDWLYGEILPAIFETAVYDAIEAGMTSFIDTRDFALRFGTLNCLGAALAWGAVGANFIVPGAGTLGALVAAGILQYEFLSWTASTGINIGQVAHSKEGLSLGNALNLTAAIADFAALHGSMAQPLRSYYPVLGRIGLGLGITAATISSVQCGADVL